MSETDLFYAQILTDLAQRSDIVCKQKRKRDCNINAADNVYNAEQAKSLDASSAAATKHAISFDSLHEDDPESFDIAALVLSERGLADNECWQRDDGVDQPQLLRQFYVK